LEGRKEDECEYEYEYEYERKTNKNHKTRETKYIKKNENTYIMYPDDEISQ
jgi:hypothetical protein